MTKMICPKWKTCKDKGRTLEKHCDIHDYKETCKIIGECSQAACIPVQEIKYVWLGI